MSEAMGSGGPRVIGFSSSITDQIKVIIIIGLASAGGSVFLWEGTVIAEGRKASNVCPKTRRGSLTGRQSGRALLFGPFGHVLDTSAT